ncbi:M15 family metallopeptidase [Bailinhaonella thermotolerans]|uniref:Peptidase M15 n=1 Tax=Bailinhaonella thermotolerans TaxID=1070861 RepID=A0A3A4AYV2_9ACTN|nr:M15 family metallopeptidase [Bailinhaonella thermotolerans]RJL35852.1 peptidase M15 [Bailinhaonella thermotolerans]
MTFREPARTAARRTPSAVAAVLVAVAVVLIGVLAHRWLSSPAATADGIPSGALGEAGGAVPDGVTVFDDEVPAVANLDPRLLAALRKAATAAARDGVEFVVNGGWRSPKYQEQLLREAIGRYGSAEEAARWVATPGKSLHVSGDAVDLGPPEALGWLSAHGREHALCQTYANEPWHYELRPKAPAKGCPRPYPDPTHDPRLQP